MHKYYYLKDVVTLQLDTHKCTGCGMCTIVCPQAVFAMNGKKAFIADRDACMECGACARNCAPGAIAVRPGVGCAGALLKGKAKEGQPSCSTDCCDAGQSCC